jgi:hypothetical protein
MAFLIQILISLVQLSAAHSWAERAMKVALDGSLIGEPGFPRGYGENSHCLYQNKRLNFKRVP